LRYILGIFATHGLFLGYMLSNTVGLVG